MNRDSERTPSTSSGVGLSRLVTLVTLGGRISLWNLALLALVITAVAVFVRRGLHFEGFWYDESVQYWISRGIDAFSAPFQKPGNIADVMYHNGRGNLDPGGYSILLHFWLLPSRTPEWQRLLPLLFFFLGCAGLAWLGWRWRRSFKFALFAALVPLAYPVLRDHANEARAYSMEFAAIIFACLTLDVVLVNPRRKYLLIGGAVIGLFFWSRYSFVLVAAAVTGAFAIHCFMVKRSLPLAARLAPVGWFILPMVVLGVLVLWLGFYPQYRDRISYENGAMVRYLDVFKASHATPGKVAQNLFHPVALPLTVIPVLVLSWLFFTRTRNRNDPSSASRHLMAPQYLVAFFTVLITASVWKWHPWAVAAKWGNYLQALSSVMLVRIVADLLALAEHKAGFRALVANFEKVTLTCATVVICVMMFNHQRTAWTNMPELIRYLDKRHLKREEVSVMQGCYPTLRYYFEDGPWQGNEDYPRVFRLPYWDGRLPLIWKKTKYLASDVSLEAARTYQPEARLSKGDGLPRNLLLVEQPVTAETAADATPQR